MLLLKDDPQVAAMIHTHLEKMTKGNYDWKNPETHPIRYYEVMEKIFSFMDDMPTEELIGAAKVVGCLSEYFWDAISLTISWECPDGHKNSYSVG